MAEEKENTKKATAKSTKKTSKAATSKKASSTKATAKKTAKPKAAAAKTSSTDTVKKSVKADLTTPKVTKKILRKKGKLSIKLKSEGLKVPKEFTYGTGRRKTSVAKVWLFPGSGNYKINNLDPKQYLNRDVLVERALKPLFQLDLNDKYDVKITVLGGGLSGQAGACQMGLARAILQIDDTFRKSLREGSFLTRDMREKERKKYGKRGARKAPQYRKR